MSRLYFFCTLVSAYICGLNVALAVERPEQRSMCIFIAMVNFAAVIINAAQFKPSKQIDNEQ